MYSVSLLGTAHAALATLFPRFCGESSEEECLPSDGFRWLIRHDYDDLFKFQELAYGPGSAWSLSDFRRLHSPLSSVPICFKALIRWTRSDDGLPQTQALLSTRTYQDHLLICDLCGREGCDPEHKIALIEMMLVPHKRRTQAKYVLVQLPIDHPDLQLLKDFGFVEKRGLLNYRHRIDLRAPHAADATESYAIQILEGEIADGNILRVKIANDPDQDHQPVIVKSVADQLVDQNEPGWRYLDEPPKQGIELAYTLSDR